nr:MAG TPA: programmed cell death activator [Caudoviricetes sp.]
MCDSFDHKRSCDFYQSNLTCIVVVYAFNHIRR